MFGGLEVSMLTFGTQVCGFEPARRRRIYRDKKNPQHAFFGGEVKSSVLRRRFAACKRSQNGVKKESFRKYYRTPFSLTVSPFATRSARVVGDLEASGGKSGTV
jgi:hypothetical protein